MNAMRLSLSVALLAAGTAGGCATVPRDAGFGDVRALVAERTGNRVHWNRGAESDPAVEAALRGMLQEELTAERAVQIALLNNRGLQATYEDLMVSQAELVAAGLLRNPVFDADIRFSTDGGGTGLELAVLQDFMDVLYIPLRKRIAQSAFEATKLRVAGQVIDLAGEARAAFHTLQAAQQTLEMRRQVVAATAASYELARRLRAAGNNTELDLANEQALYEQSKLDLRAAEADVSQGRERLNRLMGLWGPATASWSAAARLPDPPAEEVAADGLERTAVERSLNLRAARREVEAASRSLGLAAPFGLVPDAEAGVSAEREPEGGWSVGPAFSVPVPLFNQGQPAVASARARLRRARRRYAAVAVEVRSRARAARDAVAAARDQAEYSRLVVLPLRQSIVEQTQLQYNAMQVGPFQLLVAKQQQIDAGAAYIRALRAYWLARTQLDQILNGRLPPSETTASSEPPSSSTPAGGRGGH
jgi:cobalt-zinc-cadmium efflux system outer membrane protein